MTKTITAENTDELAMFRALKPYIAMCLSLNHDLNNPLSGVVGFGELLLEEAEDWPASERETLQSMLECAERIRRILDDLSEAKIKLSEEIDLNSAIEMFRKE